MPRTPMLAAAIAIGLVLPVGAALPRAAAEPAGAAGPASPDAVAVAMNPAPSNALATDTTGSTSITAADTGAVPTYPDVGAGTQVLDHAAKLGDVVEPAWYEANIGFVDLPDRTIEDTYYYRWRTFKEALKYTGPKDGWIVSEFLGPVGYSAPNGGISAAAGHHIYEGRWLRDNRYLDDYLDYWLRGSGSGPKPATDALNDNTTDWAHQYSFWAADALLARAEVNGRWDWAIDRLPELQRQWERWSPQYDDELGLYWQTPVWDAMEFTASSYSSDDPYHGGDGFRPTLNAYQYGDAIAIATLLRRRAGAGDAAEADRWEHRADRLQRAQEKWLWDSDADFYKHVMREDNPDHDTLPDREEIGFVPWYFHMAPPENSAAWAQLIDPQGFAAPYGPTTVERRSQWFMHQAEDGCCRWDGPSWPYATSQTLTALANLLLDYPDQPYVDRSDYLEVLHGYAATQRKDGKPYVAEAHHPDQDRWLYDGRGHSEDYNHSTFNDLVLSGLIGIRPQPDGVRIAPLAPADWDHFAAENVPYSGHNLSIFWDRTGQSYGVGTGLSIWVDGERVHHQSGLDGVTIPIPGSDAGPAADPASLPREVDDLANPAGNGFPAATASYTFSADSPADAIDGQDFHLDVPSTRWTTWQSPHDADWLSVDLGVPTPISDVRVAFYDDGGGVRTPQSFELDYRTAGGTWAALPGQHRQPESPTRGVLNRVVLDEPVRTDALRLRPVRDDGGAVGVTALQAWRAEDDRVLARFVDPSTDNGGDDRADNGADNGADSRGPENSATTLGLLPVRPGQTTVVTTEVSTLKSVSRAIRVTPELLVPQGWTVRALDPVRPRAVSHRHPWQIRWAVTAPDELPTGSRTPLRFLAGSSTASGAARETGALATAVAQFDPASYPATAWDDDFSTDQLADYQLDTPFGEPAPELQVADGRLTAVPAGQQSGSLLRVPAPGTARMAVIVEPAEFGGGDPEDSVFLGRAAGPDDYVTAWYNHHFGTSGADVRVAGRGYGDEATGGCCAQLSWEPGMRLAVAFDAGRMTSWVESDGRWTQLRTAPYGAAVDPTPIDDWSPAFGVRLTTGSLSLDRITVLTG